MLYNRVYIWTNLLPSYLCINNWIIAMVRVWLVLCLILPTNCDQKRLTITTKDRYRKPRAVSSNLVQRHLYLIIIYINGNQWRIRHYRVAWAGQAQINSVHSSQSQSQHIWSAVHLIGWTESSYLTAGIWPRTPCCLELGLLRAGTQTSREGAQSKKMHANIKNDILKHTQEQRTQTKKQLWTRYCLKW